MTEFIISEDFPRNQVDFDKRFSSEQACRDYLAKIKCLLVSAAVVAGTNNIGLVLGGCTSALAVNLLIP